MSKTPKEQIGVDLPDEEPVVIEPVAAAEEPEEPAADERPDWLPEQYKTPEDFVAANKSLQERLRQEAEARKADGTRLAELEAYVQSQQTETRENDVLSAVADELAVAREAGDVRRELELQQWLNEQTLRTTLAGLQEERSRADEAGGRVLDELVAEHVGQGLRASYDDWEEYAPRVRELISEEPWRLPAHVLDSVHLSQRAIAAVYTELKAQDIIEQHKELEERGLSQADLSRARKLGAQTMSGASGRPDEPSDVDRQIAEMQQSLRGSSWAAIRSGK